MAKYHEVGRFIVGDTKDENDIDWESAIFHEEHAAELGELEAMVTMAKLYLGQERDVLVNCVVEVGVTVNCVVEVGVTVNCVVEVRVTVNCVVERFWGRHQILS